MANLPRPKVLPKVQYDPPQSNPAPVAGQASANGYVDPYGAMSAGEAWDNQRALAMGLTPQGTVGANLKTLAGATGGQTAPITVTYDPNPVAANYGLPMTTQPPTNTPPASPGGGGADPRDTEHIKSQAEEALRLRQAVTNNQTNTKAAQAAGDTAALARLTEEWNRLTQSPLYKTMWGSSDPNAMKARLVNVYMDPKNPAAQRDFESAAARAASDDIWAREATNAFGRPPNQLEWDQHWQAMNVGGRDPLEGHPQAIQNIKAAATGLQTGNQQDVFNQYSNWLGH